MAYIAAVRFADLQDGNRIYEAGETYPRPGFEVTEERLAELAGSDNRMGYPLIQAVPDPEPEPEPDPEQRPRPARKRVKNDDRADLRGDQ